MMGVGPKKQTIPNSFSKEFEATIYGSVLVST